MGLYEWTISRFADDSDGVFFLFSLGYQYDYATYNGNVFDYGVARPSFNLKSSITYVSGAGTQSSPIIIN